MKWFNAISERELAAVPTPEPYKSDGAVRLDHQTIPFSEGPELVRKHLHNYGYEVGESQFVLDEPKLGFIGSMEVLDENGEALLSDIGALEIIMWGSHNKRVAWQIGTGTNNPICINFELFNANLSQFKAKHTVNALPRLDTMVALSVARIGEVAEDERRRQEALKSYHLTKEEGDHHLVEIHLGKQGMTSSQLSVAVSEWRNPSYLEHTVYDDMPHSTVDLSGYDPDFPSANVINFPVVDRTGRERWSAYRLLQACTEAQKPADNRTRINYNHIANRTITAGNYINDVIGFQRAA
jgi:hypothetical protein